MKTIYKRVASILVGMGLIVGASTIEMRNIALVGGLLIPQISKSQTQEITPLQREFDSYLASLPDVLRWQLYLYQRTQEANLTYRDYLRLKRLVLCESGWRQYNSSGEVLSGYIHPADKGLFQINTATSAGHLEASQLVGYDIFTPYGNLDYGVYLFQQQGTKPWVCAE